MITAEAKLANAKAKAQEEVTAMIDKHFARYGTAAKNKKLTIDMVEDFMGEAMAEGERIIKEAASSAISSIETDLVEKKPYVRAAMKK